jgi:hypothetical protein
MHKRCPDSDKGICAVKIPLFNHNDIHMGKYFINKSFSAGTGLSESEYL